MSTTKKLSEDLNDAIYFELTAADKNALAAEARALEERVAELEADLTWRADIAGDEARIAYGLERSYSAATARAEAAEAEVARLHVEWKRADGLREDNQRIASVLQDERDALRAKLEKARAKVDAGVPAQYDYDEYYGYKKALEDISEAILDGEGDDE